MSYLGGPDVTPAALVIVRIEAGSIPTPPGTPVRCRRDAGAELWAVAERVEMATGVPSRISSPFSAMRSNRNRASRVSSFRAMSASTATSRASSSGLASSNTSRSGCVWMRPSRARSIRMAPASVHASVQPGVGIRPPLFPSTRSRRISSGDLGILAHPGRQGTRKRVPRLPNPTPPTGSHRRA